MAAVPSSKSKPAFASNRFWAAALVLLLLLAVIAVRVRLLNVPLERDEGEYAYAGQLLLQGTPPYHDLYSMKWPGTFAAYAMLMAIFGQTIAGIHIGLVVVNLATAALVFLLTKRICGVLGGLIAGTTYALLSITPFSYGLAAHATHFVLLPALGGILLIQALKDNVQPWHLICAGALFGLAALMKQAGAVFGAFGAIWVFWQEFSRPDRRWERLGRRLAWLAVGGLGIFGLTLAWLALAGVFARFWLWTFQYSRAYVSIITFKEAVGRLWEFGGRLVASAPGLWLLAGAGLVMVCLRGTKRFEFSDVATDQTAREPDRWRVFLVGFLMFSFLGVCPGGYFRGHYFLLLFPALGALVGFAVQAGADLLSGGRKRPAFGVLPVLLFLLAGGLFLYQSRAVFFEQKPAQVARTIYGLNPFPESVELGRFLQEHCPANGRIAVVGSEPQLYFYSGRRSATGFVYTYPLLEPQPYAKAMQQEMIEEILRSNPDLFVFVSQPSSWLPREGSDVSIIEWFIKYRQDHLEPVALIDILPDGSAEYSWSGAANPRSDQWLQVYRRRGM